MARSVLADSEGEEEDLLSSENRQKSGNTKQSTASMERLQRQIAQAERDLTSQMDSVAKQQQQTQCSAISTSKRRHSEVPTELTTPYTYTKRTKSANHASSDSSGLLSPSMFPSQPFTEHTQTIISPQFVPPGSITEGFLAHEPIMMFGQTGDTVPDNSATQSLMREIAAGKHNNTNAPDRADVLELAHAQQSSSVLLSASQLYGDISTTTSNHPSYRHEVAPLEHDTVRMSQLQNFSHDDEGLLQNQHATTEACTEMITTPSQQTSSVSTEAGSQNITCQQSKLDDNMTVSGASGDLSAAQQDQAGSPNEDIIVKPTNRRATQISAITEDKSARKSKKRATGASHHIVEKTNTRATRSRTTETAKQPETTTALPQPDVEAEEMEDIIVVAQARHVGPAIAEHHEHALNIEDEREPSHISSQDELALPVKTHTSQDHQFVRPELPTKKKKMAAKKTRRSHTTIFEDHVELEIVPQAQTLTQRQAARKLALQAVQNEAKKSTKAINNSKSNADDHDELALDFEAGMLPLAVQTTVQAAQSKHAAAHETNDKTIDDNNASTTTTHDASAVKLGSQVSDQNHVPTPEPTPSPERTPPDQIVQMPVDTEIKDPANIRKQKGSPTTHSAIKALADTKYRVGLSKRQRIPSLLKIVKPSKKVTKA